MSNSLNPLYYPFYFFPRALKGIKEHLLLNVITISTITLSMVILGTFSMVFINIKSLIDNWERKVRITAYLNEDVKATEIKDMRKKILGMEYVEDVRYISKEEAYRIFKKELKGLSDILDGLQDNPLPASFEIRLKNMEVVKEGERLGELITFLKGLKGIEEVDYGGELLEKLSNLFFFFKFILIFLSSFLFLTIMLIISNAVRMTLFARRKEIEIMKLVGATNAFIKMPFIIEGFLQGLLGAVFAGLIIITFYILFFPRVEPILDLLLGSSSDMFFTLETIVIGMILLGCILGVLGSLVSIRRFLKV